MALEEQMLGKNPVRKKSMKRLILDYSFGNVILLFVGLGILYSVNDSLKDRILRNTESVKKVTIEKGDTYSGYAANLREEYPCIKESGFDRTIHYIQHNLNKGKPLIAGKKVAIPVYNCTK